MAGLLQKLNKKPRRPVREQSSSRIVVTQDEHGTHSTTVQIAQAPQPISNEGRSFTQEISRQGNESLPRWLSSPPVTSPRVDAIVPLAHGLMNQELGKEIKDEEDFRRLLRKAVQTAAGALPSDESLSPKENESAVLELWNLLKGKGPLEQLFNDSQVTDIFVTNYETIRCVRGGQLMDTPFRFRSSDEYQEFLDALLSSADASLTKETPAITCSLADRWRSRVSAFHSSLLDSEESSLSIRIPRLPQVSFYELIRAKTLPATVAAWLTEIMATHECSILVTGASGTGKTTLSAALLSAAPSEDKIITIEEVPELFPTSHYMEKIITSPLSKATTAPRLIELAIRRLPKLIACGELSAGESPAILRALESGIPTLVTLSAKNLAAAIRLLADDLAATTAGSSKSEYTERLYASFGLVIVMGTSEGRPFIQSISEITNTLDQVKVTEILSFAGESGGKRAWHLSSPQAQWVQLLSERGHPLRLGGGLLASPK